MRNIVLLVAMITSAIAGYFVGGYRGRAAEEALARANASASAAEAQHQKAMTDLAAKIGALSSTYAQEKRRREAQFEKQKLGWNKTVAGSDREIANLTASIAAKKQGLAKLRALSGQAKEPEQEQLLLKEIARLDAELKGQQATLTGLECSQVPVPGQLLNILKEGAP